MPPEHRPRAAAEVKAAGRARHWPVQNGHGKTNIKQVREQENWHPELQKKMVSFVRMDGFSVFSHMIRLDGEETRHDDLSDSWT